MNIKEKLVMVRGHHPEVSIRKQCEWLDMNRSTYYYEPQPEDAYNLLLMNLIDEQYTRTPYYGSPRLTAWLRRQGHEVNRKRVQRLMSKMGISAIYPTRNTSPPGAVHKIFPYLLKGFEISRTNQVWSADITYIRLRLGFLYLVAIMDWHSRYVLSWALSNTLDVNFCLEALREALMKGCPDIFNTDQGSQFTSEEFVGKLLEKNISISMDGKGRALDNVFVERLWRSVKYENIYLNHYESAREVHKGLREYFEFYNNERPHQSLNYRTPAEVHDVKGVEKEIEQGLEDIQTYAYAAMS